MGNVLVVLQGRLDGVDEKSKKAKSGIAEFATAAGAATYVLKTGLGVLGDLADGLLRLGEITYHATQSFMSFVLGVASEREGTITALRSVLGNETGVAEGVWNEAVLAAQRTPFETADVVARRMDLVLQDFNAEESRTLYAASADIGAALGPERQQILINAFGRIRAQGGIHGEVLRELTAAGIGQRGLFMQMAREAGRQDLLSNERALGEWGRQRIAGLSSNQALALIVQNIRGRFDTQGGRNPGALLGQFARDQSQTLSGILSNLQSLPHDVFASLAEGIDRIPGIQSFKSFLQSFMALFDQTSERGQRFQRVLVHIANALFGGLFGGDAQENGRAMEGVFDRITAALDTFANALDVIVPAVRAFMEGLGSGLLSSFEEILGGVNGQAGTFRDFPWELMGRTIGLSFGIMFEAVSALVNAMQWLIEHFQTFMGIAGDVFPGVANMANGIVDTVQSVLGIHSPSTVFNEIGRNTVRGFQQGMEAESAGLHSSLARNLPLNASMSLQSGIQHKVSVDPIQVHATGEGNINAAAANQIGITVATRMRDGLRRTDLTGVDS